MNVLLFQQCGDQEGRVLVNFDDANSHAALWEDRYTRPSVLVVRENDMLVGKKHQWPWIAPDAKVETRHRKNEKLSSWTF